MLARYNLFLINLTILSKLNVVITREVSSLQELEDKLVVLILIILHLVVAFRYN